jgi:hypothetical protein
MDDGQSVNGLVILTAKINDPSVREEFWHHMENIPGERVTLSIYEFSTADWDEGLWDDEIQWMSDLLEGVRATGIIWRFEDGKYSRFSMGWDN